MRKNESKFITFLSSADASFSAPRRLRSKLRQSFVWSSVEAPFIAHVELRGSFVNGSFMLSSLEASFGDP